MDMKYGMDLHGINILVCEFQIRNVEALNFFNRAVVSFKNLSKFIYLSINIFNTNLALAILVTSDELLFTEKSVRQRRELSQPVTNTELANENYKSDVFYTLAPIYHISKICGILPVNFTLDNKSGKYSGQLRIPQVLYG